MHMSHPRPSNSPELLSKSDENTQAECVIVMNEVRRVTQLMEIDRQVAASRASRLLKELMRTLDILGADRSRRSVLERKERYRNSTDDDHKKLKEIRSTPIRDRDARKLYFLPISLEDGAPF